MRLLVSVILFAIFVVFSEKSNNSQINPYAVSFIFSVCYFYVSLILFQYADFKRKIGDKYLVELMLVLLSMHLYGSRLMFDSINYSSIVVMIVNVLFSAFLLKKISIDCKLIPNIKSFSQGAFGEYPIKNKESLQRVKPLFWLLLVIPFLSYILWL